MLLQIIFKALSVFYIMLIQGKYRVTQLLGQGSYSRVYEAIYDEKGTKVAIKFDLETALVLNSK